MCSECRVDSVMFISWNHGVELPEDGVMPKHVATIKDCKCVYQRCNHSIKMHGINSVKTGWGCWRVGCWERYLGPRRRKWQGCGGDCIMRSAVIFTADQIKIGWQNQGWRECWWGEGVRGRYRREQKCIRDFVGETWRKEITWKTQD